MAMEMPVFMPLMQPMMVPMYVPVGQPCFVNAMPTYAPQESVWGSEADFCDCPSEQAGRRQEETALSRFLERPREDFSVKNGFITVEEAPRSSRRSSSCPPNVLKMEHPAETVVMLQNLPNRATKAKVHAHVAGLGVKRSVELDLPLDRRTGVNKGYAFLKFPNMKDATRFVAEVAGTQLKGSKSLKRLSAVLALGHGLRRRAQVSAEKPEKMEKVCDASAAAAACC